MTLNTKNILWYGLGTIALGSLIVLSYRKIKANNTIGNIVSKPLPEIPEVEAVKFNAMGQPLRPLATALSGLNCNDPRNKNNPDCHPGLRSWNCINNPKAQGCKEPMANRVGFMRG